MFANANVDNVLYNAAINHPENRLVIALYGAYNYAGYMGLYVTRES